MSSDIEMYDYLGDFPEKAIVTVTDPLEAVVAKQKEQLDFFLNMAKEFSTKVDWAGSYTLTALIAQDALKKYNEAMKDVTC